MSTPIWYATREAVTSALESASTARTTGQVDRALGAATGQIHGLTHRRFYPELGTWYHDGPLSDSSDSQIIYLDGDHELASATSIAVDGVALATTDYVLRPDTGPPYTRIEIARDSSAGWVSGQREIAITGVRCGAPLDETPAGALGAAIATTSVTTITITDPSLVGVGHILRVDDERMIVTGRGWADTGQTLGGSGLTASAAGVALTVADPSGLHAGEVLLLDAERMLVTDVAGTTVVVRRAVDGSVLAAHSVGAAIYASRSLTVTRGALGTTAAIHDDATALVRHVPPPLVEALAVAEAMNTLLQESSGYARVAGSGDNAREFWGRSLAGLRDQVYTAHGRKARIGAV